MAKIRFATGQVVNFDGDPTPDDIEEVASQLESSRTSSDVPKWGMEHPNLYGAKEALLKPGVEPNNPAIQAAATLIQPTFKTPFTGNLNIPNPLTVGMPLGMTPMAGKEETAQTLSNMSSPAMLAASAIPAAKAGNAIAEGFEGLRATPDVLRNRSYKLATEVLNPPVNELAGFKGQGKVMPAVKEAADVLSEAKTYGEAQKQIEDTISKVMNERNALIKEPKLMGDYTQGLQEEIARARKMGQVTPAELKQMEDTLSREQNWMKNNPVTREGLQSRKEELQRMTESVLQKNSEGQYVQPSRKMALDLVRRGIKESIEAGDQHVADLNSRYGGLLKAKELLARQGALADKAIPPNTLKKIISAVTNLKGTVMEEALSRQGGLAGTTRKIANIRSKITQ